MRDMRRIVKDEFEVVQMKQFCMMHQHMSTQDSNFEDFASFVIESLVSLQTNMNENHDAILAMINHLISAREADSGHYKRFY